MTVGELIIELQQYDLSLQVQVCEDYYVEGVWCTSLYQCSMSSDAVFDKVYINDKKEINRRENIEG